jgi:hypothetical protein
MKTKEILLELIDYLDEYENESAHTDKTLSTSDFLVIFFTLKLA